MYPDPLKFIPKRFETQDKDRFVSILDELPHAAFGFRRRWVLDLGPIYSGKLGSETPHRSKTPPQNGSTADIPLIICMWACSRARVSIYKPAWCNFEWLCVTKALGRGKL
jgi:hypothetical protein